MIYFVSPQNLLARLDQKPFKPFRVRLTNNGYIDVLHFGTASVGLREAVMPLQIEVRDGFPLVSRWKTIPLNEMTELLELE